MSRVSQYTCPHTRVSLSCIGTGVTPGTCGRREPPASLSLPDDVAVLASEERDALGP